MMRVKWREWFLVAIVCVVALPALCAAKGDAWLRVATPEITVITPLPEKEATAWAAEFAQYLAALRAFFRDERTKLPALTIVVFAREKDFERYYPLLGPGGKPQEVGGFFSRHESWSIVGLRTRVSEETRRTIFHEGLHWFMSTTNTRNPVWLEEGLAEVFSTFNMDKNRAEWGRAIEEHVMLLRSAAPLPLEKLLYTAQGDLFGNDARHTGIIYAESWAFVHFLIFGKHDISRRAIAVYIEAISSGVHPDEAFRRAFKRDYAQMDRLLQEYLAGGTYFVAKQPLAPVAPPTVQPASQLEVEDALGRLAFAGNRWELATKHARAAVGLAPDDPRGHELLAVALKQTGDGAGAAAEFNAAVDHGSKDFQPYFELALLAQNKAVEHGELAPAEARQIANRYERAINLYPRFRTSYENLGGIVGIAEPLGEEDRKFLELGVRLFPDSPMIQLGLAQLTRRNGDPAGARAQLDRVLASLQGISNSAATYAHRLDAAWEQQDIGAQIDELGKAGKFAEAIALIDDKIAHGVESSVRVRLTTLRHQLQTARLSQRVKEALDAREWTAARAALAELLESDAAPTIKTHARRTLADLDRRKLGVDEEKP